MVNVVNYAVLVMVLCLISVEVVDRLDYVEWLALNLEE